MLIRENDKSTVHPFLPQVLLLRVIAFKQFLCLFLLVITSVKEKTTGPKCCHLCQSS